MNPNSTTAAGSEPPDMVVHVAEVRVLAGVFAALVILTTITVAVSYFDFGSLNLLVAMGVATLKAALVALYFMHLRYDGGFNAIVFLIGVAFLGLFLSVTLLDSVAYQPSIDAWQESRP